MSTALYRDYALPRGDHQNGWDSVDIASYSLDGIDTSKGCALALCEVAAFSSGVKVPFYTDLPRYTVDANPHFEFVMHFDMHPMHLCMTFVGLSFNRVKGFVETDDKDRNNRLQMIIKLVDGNCVVRRLLTEPFVANIGLTIPCHWKRTGNLLECTCDVASSVVMRGILSMAKSCCKSMVCEFVFVVANASGPATALGGVRIIRHDMSSYPPVVTPRTCP